MSDALRKNTEDEESFWLKVPGLQQLSSTHAHGTLHIHSNAKLLTNSVFSNKARLFPWTMQQQASSEMNLFAGTNLFQMNPQGAGASATPTSPDLEVRKVENPAMIAGQQQPRLQSGNMELKIQIAPNQTAEIVQTERGISLRVRGEVGDDAQHIDGWWSNDKESGNDDESTAYDEKKWIDAPGSKWLQDADKQWYDANAENWHKNKYDDETKWQDQPGQRWWKSQDGTWMKEVYDEDTQSWKDSPSRRKFQAQKKLEEAQATLALVDDDANSTTKKQQHRQQQQQTNGANMRAVKTAIMPICAMLQKIMQDMDGVEKVMGADLTGQMTSFGMDPTALDDDDEQKKGAADHEWTSLEPQDASSGCGAAQDFVEDKTSEANHC